MGGYFIVVPTMPTLVNMSYMMLGRISRVAISNIFQSIKKVKLRANQDFLYRNSFVK